MIQGSILQEDTKTMNLYMQLIVGPKIRKLKTDRNKG